MTKRAKLYALVAEFDRPDALVDAARKARARGFGRIEAFSPFPVEDLAEALGFEERAITPIVLVGALVGLALGLGLQVAANLAFPLNIGGRPLLSWPAFALIAFELTVLVAVCAGVAAMLVLNRLPRLHHPLFDLESFHFASSDKFFLAVLAADPDFERAATRRFLKSLDPVSIAAIADEEGVA